MAELLSRLFKLVSPYANHCWAVQCSLPAGGPEDMASADGLVVRPFTPGKNFFQCTNATTEKAMRATKLTQPMIRNKPTGFCSLFCFFACEEDRRRLDERAWFVTCTTLRPTRARFLAGGARAAQKIRFAAYAFFGRWCFVEPFRLIAYAHQEHRLTRILQKIDNAVLLVFQVNRFAVRQ